MTRARGTPVTPVVSLRNLAAIAGLACFSTLMGGAPQTDLSAQAGQAGAASATVTLTDVAGQAGLTLVNIHGDPVKDYIVDTNGNGAAWFDYDNDGDLDLAIVGGSTLSRLAKGGDPLVTLYRNDGKGHFIDVTAQSGLATRGWGMGACVADVDNDGFRDLYVTAFGPNALFHNNGDGTFADVTSTSRTGDGRWGMNCAFADYDRDGDLDLYVANYVRFDAPQSNAASRPPVCRYQGLPVFCGPVGLPSDPDVLYRNEGNGTFTDVTERAGIRDSRGYGFGVLFSDVNDDGWPDVFVANDSVPSLLFLNRGDGTFRESGLVSGVALNGDGRAQAAMGADAGDYDGDGDLDIVITAFSGDYNTLFENEGHGVFADVTRLAGLASAALPYLGWGVGFVDFDNDGWLDLFTANGHVYPTIDRQGLGVTFHERNQLFRNLGNKRFRVATTEGGSGLLVEKSSRGAAFADYDNDGDIDVLVVNLNDRPTLLRNDTQGGGHWVTLRLAGVKGNRDAIGAKVRARAGGRTFVAEVRSGGSYLSGNDPRVHIGLGAFDRIESLEVRWPSGAVDTFGGVRADRFYVVREAGGMTPEK